MWELPKFVQKYNKIQTQLSFFLAHLLVLLVDCLHFCLGGLVSLTVGLAIRSEVSIAGQVVVNLSG